MLLFPLSRQVLAHLDIAPGAEPVYNVVCYPCFRLVAWGRHVHREEVYPSAPL